MTPETVLSLLQHLASFSPWTTTPKMSKKSEVEAIDAFFDSYFEDMDTTVTDLTIESPEILYGSLIQALNTKNR